MGEGTMAVKVVPPQSKARSPQKNGKADVPDQGSAHG